MTYMPPEHLATKAQLDQKANASTVGGLAMAVNSKAPQAALDDLAAQVAEIAAMVPDGPPAEPEG